MFFRALLALWLALTPALADGVSAPGVPRPIGLGREGAAVKYPPGPGAPVYVGPGDTISGAVFWGGLRAYNAAYAATRGKAVNLRRASDNTACDFDVSTSGNLGTSDPACSIGGGLTLAAFAGQDATCTGTSSASATITVSGCSSTPNVGSTLSGTGVTSPVYITAVSVTAGAGTITVNQAQTLSSAALTLTYGLYAAKLYDQSGANDCAGIACDITQATAAKQPQLLPSCIGSNPCLSFVAANSQNLIGAVITLTSGTILTISLVSVRMASFTTVQKVFGSASGNMYVYYYVTANTMYMAQGAAANIGLTVTDSIFHALQFIFTGSTTSFANVDGVSGASLSFGSTAWSSGPQLGAAGSSNYSTGYVAEAAIWNVAFTSGQAIAMCHNQYTYWGTPTSC